MALILDADSIIKLNRVGALGVVAGAFECVIPEAVYQEAVVNAKARGYADAETIDGIIRELITIVAANPLALMDISRNIGPGETEVLALAQQSSETAIVVSDDEDFLRYARRRGIRHVTPIGLVPWLAQEWVISIDQARELIELSRHLTNERNYLAAMAELEVSEK